MSSRTGAGARVLSSFDAEGDALAVLSADGRLRLWDAATGKQRQQYRHHLHHGLVELSGRCPTADATFASGARSRMRSRTPLEKALCMHAGVTVCVASGFCYEVVFESSRPYTQDMRDIARPSNGTRTVWLVRDLSHAAR